MPPIRYERSTIMELLLQIGGTPDHGNGQFNEPTGIVVDSSGNVFVVDRGNNRIQEFSPK